MRRSLDDDDASGRPVRDVPSFTDRRDPPRIHVPPVRAVDDRSALPALPEPAGGAVPWLPATGSGRVQESRFLRLQARRALLGLETGVGVPVQKADVAATGLQPENGTFRPDTAPTRTQRRTETTTLDASRHLATYSADITKTGYERDEYPSSVGIETRWLVETGVATAANGPGSLRTERQRPAA